MDKKHIQNVTETDNSVTITFEKDNGSNDKGISKKFSSETSTDKEVHTKDNTEQKNLQSKEDKENKMMTQKSDK